jgi:hypothetical protein
VTTYTGKYAKYIYPISNGRFVAALKIGGRWYTRLNRVRSFTISGVSPLDLVANGARTYASVNSAINAFRRVYTDIDAGEARTQEPDVAYIHRSEMPRGPLRKPD